MCYAISILILHLDVLRILVSAAKFLRLLSHFDSIAAKIQNLLQMFRNYAKITKKCQHSTGDDKNVSSEIVNH